MRFGGNNPDRISPSPNGMEESANQIVENLKDLLPTIRQEDPIFVLNSTTLASLIKEYPNTFLGLKTTVQVLKLFGHRIVDLIERVENSTVKEEPIQITEEPEIQRSIAREIDLPQGLPVKVADSPEVLKQRAILIPILYDWFAHGRGKSLFDFMRNDSQNKMPPLTLEQVLPFFKNRKSFLKSEVRKYREN